MKVILLKDVDNLGKKHDIVEVNDGYAKNFLIKNNLAVQETKASLNKLSIELEHEQEAHDLDVYNAELLKNKLEEMKPVFYLKSNHHGGTFGKISAKEFIDEINKDQKLINKYMLVEKEWGLGPHKVKVKLHPEVEAIIQINVLENN